MGPKKPIVANFIHYIIIFILKSEIIHVRDAFKENEEENSKWMFGRVMGRLLSLLYSRRNNSYKGTRYIDQIQAGGTPA